MAYKLEDKINIIYLKNQLINATTKQLKKKYSNHDNFGFFIDTLNIALNDEPVYFLLDDEILNKAENIIAHRRFEFDDESFNTVINEIINQLNGLKAIPEQVKETQKKAYISFQQSTRQMVFDDMEDFLSAIAYDAVLIQKLTNGELAELEPAYFFASTNYLAQTLPEFYQKRPMLAEINLKKLEEHTHKKGLSNWGERAFAKEAVKNLQKVKV